jgi:outer membrane protein
MRFFKITCHIFVFLLGFNYVFSQQSVELNFKQAVENAVKTNINVIRAENTISSQSFNIKGKYGALLPSLSFSGAWQRTNEVLIGNALQNSSGLGSFGNQISGSTNQTNYNYSLGFRSDLTIFNGLTNYQEVDLEKKTQANNYILLEKTKQDLVLQILNDYITVLKNQQIVKIDSATLVNSQLELDLIKQFVDAGKKTLADVYNQDALVAQNELVLEQAKNGLNKSISDLVFDANMSQVNTYSVRSSDFASELSLDYINTYVQQNSNVDLLVNTAIKNRYDYQSSQQIISINESNLDISTNTILFPTLSGFSTYGWSGNSFQNIANSKIFTLGLTLSYPIFEGFSVDNQKQIAEINLKESNQDLIQLKKQITNDIQKAVLDIKSLVKQIEITERTLKSAEQNKLLAEESYKVGLQTLLDVQTATINYNNAQITKSNLIYNFQFSQKQLEYFQGLLKY